MKDEDSTDLKQRFQTESKVRPTGYINFLRLYYLRRIVATANENSFNQIKETDTYKAVVKTERFH